MFNRIHQKLGTAGFIISIVALVAALGGGAYAASGGLSGKQKKEVEKIAKKFAGKPGAPGANGTNGASGPKGDTGAAGTNGTNGTNGSNGAPGKSVTLTTEPKGANCAEGGTKVEVEGNAASKKFVCNGSPWTAGGTLPPGATETGIWSADTPAAVKFTQVPAPISFAIPVSAPGKAFFLTAAEIVEEKGKGFEEGCTGTIKEPTAPKGVLCIYASEELVNVKPEPPISFAEDFGYQRTGTLLRLFPEEEGEPLLGIGSWAVTAP